LACHTGSGKINEEWDRDFLDRLMRNDAAAALSTMEVQAGWSGRLLLAFR